MGDKLEILKIRCPVCGTIFEFPKCGYTPKTCSNKDCILKYYHKPKERFNYGSSNN